MDVKFHVKLTQDAEDMRAVEYRIKAYIEGADDALNTRQAKILEGLYDIETGEYVVGMLKATRHSSPAINLLDLEREHEKNPNLIIDSDIGDRLFCHAEEMSQDLHVPSLIGEANGLIAITYTKVHPCARGESLGLTMLRHLQELHAGSAMYAVLCAEPWMAVGTPWNQVCEAGHKLTLSICFDDGLGFEPIPTCDGINLLVAFWDSSRKGMAQETTINLDAIIHKFETTSWTD